MKKQNIRVHDGFELEEAYISSLPCEGVLLPTKRECCTNFENCHTSEHKFDADYHNIFSISKFALGEGS